MELDALDAGAIVRGVADGAFSVTEVVEHALARARAIQAAHNAFVTLDDEAALTRAGELDSHRVASSGPLRGVPFTVKDLLDTAGLRTTCGSRALSENVPGQDAAAVARVRAAGAILIGKTTTPEFATQIRTDSLLCGVTTNPWNATLSPGGSSGGAGVAVASGASPFDVSTDGAGSSRVPGAACGILGLKPTLGAIPHETWPFHYGNNSTVSINARATADLVAVFNVMMGPHRLDPWSRRPRAELLSPIPERHVERRILYLPAMAGMTVDRPVLESMEAALGMMEGDGYRVDVDAADPTGFDPTIATRLMTCNLAARFRAMPAAQQALLNPALQALVDAERFTQDAVAMQAEAIERSRLYDRLEGLLERYDLIVTPTLTARPPVADPQTAPEVCINGEWHGIERWWVHLGLPNLTGHPAISVPCGQFPDGLPIGLHAIGGWDAEQVLVDLASVVEVRAPWQRRWTGASG